MATDFAVSLHRFLTSYLAGLRGYSPNTIASYRDAFKLLIGYLRDERNVPPEKLTLDMIDAEVITGFLDWYAAAGTTAPRPAISAWPRSTRSSPGCRHRTRLAWRAAKTS